jgi:hypothetical protein
MVAVDDIKENYVQYKQQSSSLIKKIDKNPSSNEFTFELSALEGGGSLGQLGPFLKKNSLSLVRVFRAV